VGKCLNIEPYPQSSGKKLHANPVTNQSCLNVENTTTERGYVIKPATNEFAKDEKIPMQNHKKHEKQSNVILMKVNKERAGQRGKRKEKKYNVRKEKAGEKGKECEEQENGSELGFFFFFSVSICFHCTSSCCVWVKGWTSQGYVVSVRDAFTLEASLLCPMEAITDTMMFTICVRRFPLSSEPH
jgi:hypothetical protein